MVVDVEQVRRMEFHEVANIFPMMGDEDYMALVADIQYNGLLEPIWTYQGKIIDGRNRYKACLEIDIEPQFREWGGHGSLVAFVVSLNLKRRHLTSSQKAMIALEVESQLAKEAEKRMLAGKAYDPGTILSQGRSAHQAAVIIGTSGTYVKEAKKIVEQAPELKNAVLNGTLNIPEAKVIAPLPKEQRDVHVMRVMGSSESPEWYTQQEIVGLTRMLLGEIDLDPCSNSYETPNVPATTLYTKEDDGLSQPWQGKVYLNPPYGSEIPQWVEKLVASYGRREVTEAIALLPARIDTQWFQALYEEPDCLLCHVRGRIQFENSPHHAPFPCVIAYLGKRGDDFIKVFRHKGPIMRRVG